METFKVGDEVYSTADGGGFYERGAAGTVKEIHGDYIWVKFHTGTFKLPFGTMGGWCAQKKDLRHVAPAPKNAPAVASDAVVLTVDGIEYAAMFTFVGDRTGCALYWHEDGREYALAGGCKRNPRDAYDRKIGMRVAMQRACGVNAKHAPLILLRPVYDAFRRWQYEQETRPLAVGDEVEAVKDDYSGRKFFRKGARGEIVVINMGNHSQQYYLVQFTSGDYNRADCAPRQTTANGQWWARPDEIRWVK